MSQAHKQKSRQAFMLFVDCGHLISTIPSTVDLSPATRNIEIELSNYYDVCLWCATPEETPFDLQSLHNLCTEMQGHHSARLGAAGTEKEKSIAERDKDSYDLDSKYVEGIMAGIQCKPIYHMIRENHLHNAQRAWFCGKDQLAELRGETIGATPVDDLVEEVHDYVKVMTHRIGISWSYAQGLFLGKRWAELEEEKGLLVALQAKVAATETHPSRNSCMRSVGPIWIVDKGPLLKRIRLRNKNIGKAAFREGKHISDVARRRLKRKTSSSSREMSGTVIEETQK